MDLISCLIIDDERLARAELAALLKEVGGCKTIGEASNATEAKRLIEQLKPELIFLDINMPGTNGFELLAQLDNPPQVVFATAYDQYAIQAFEVRALDYLLKPISLNRLQACLATIRQRMKHSPKYLERLFIPLEQGGFFLDLDEVHLIRAYGHYLRMYYGSNSCMIHRSLKSMAEQLDPNSFFQINRSEIVRLSAISSTTKISRGRYQLELGQEQVMVAEARAVIWRKRFGS
ncbi:MAG: response regulator transcription factor [Bacteroidota bacterium]